MSEDMIFLFDTARFKYPPHWCALDTFYDSVVSMDTDLGKYRGFCFISKKQRHIERLKYFEHTNIDHEAIDELAHFICTKLRRESLATFVAENPIDSAETKEHKVMRFLLTSIGNLDLVMTSIMAYLHNLTNYYERDDH